MSDGSLRKALSYRAKCMGGWQNAMDAYIDGGKLPWFLAEKWGHSFCYVFKCQFVELIVTTKETYIELLRAAIQGKHSCKAFHVESVPVVAQMNGKTVWDGAVEVFELRNNSQSRWCYGWIERPSEREQRFVIILQKGLIVTPQHAVHGWLASKPVTVSPVVETKTPGRGLLHFPDDGWASNWKDDAEMRHSNESN